MKIKDEKMFQRMEHMHIADKLREVHATYQENNSIQNVHTPKTLADDIINRIGLDQFEGKDVLVIANYDVVKLLAWMKGHKKSINFKSLTFLTDIDLDLLPQKDRDLSMYNTIVADLSSPDTIDMMGKKFDIVIGNPPYQHTTGSSAGKPLWHFFVDVVLDVCQDGGYVSLIHPSGWRNGKSKFKSVSKRLRNYQIDYCVLSNYDTGLEYFGVNTTCDWYVLRKTATHTDTCVVDCDGKTTTINLKDVDQIPNSIPTRYAECIDLTMTNSVSVNGDTTYHTQKAFLQKTEDDTYKYPVVYTLKQSGPSFWYTCDNTKAHFGTPKILLGRGLGQPVLDLKGEMAPCEFSYYLTAENTDILEKMYVALCKPECIKLCKQLGSGKGHNYLKEAVRLLHKDFWKHFQ